jgi:DNA helicase-2/ATP-dependent DNA helicase PcrA
MELDRNYSGVKTVMMMENYRSTPQILRAVNSLIAKNKHRIPKDLIPVRQDGERPRFCFAENSEAEGKWIAGELKRLHEAGERFGDMAILYRAHYVTRTVEEALRKAELPYTIYSGASFFDRREVKDALAYLRMVAYQDDLSFLRVANVPRRNLGQRRMAFLRACAAEHQCSLYAALKENLESEVLKGTKAASFVALVEQFAADCHARPVSEVLAAVVNESGLEQMLRTEGSQERLDNLAELKQSVYEYEVNCGEECTLEDYLAHVALFTNADSAEKGDKIKLMTVHAAKGLEFPTVVLCGMDEGIFPSRKVKTLPGMEEERRLAFVAMTRAERRLYLTGSGGRNHDGSPRFPSRFVLDIDPSLVDYVLPPEEGLIRCAREYIDSSSRFLKGEEEPMLSVGTRVKHAMFGVGTIVEVDEKKRAYVVKFEGLETPRKLSGRVKLEVV